MKYLSLLFSFLIEKYKSEFQPQASFLTEGIILKIRKMVFLFSLLVSAVFGFSLIFIKFIEEIGLQFENGNGLSFSGHLAAATFGLLSFAIVFVYAIDRKRWTQSDAQKEQQKPPPAARAPSPLEEALALLVADFVKERQLNREFKDQDRKREQTDKASVVL